MKEEKKQDIENMKKEIVVARLKQASSKMSISFGSKGEFLKRDELISEVENDTDIGKKIIQIQLEYLKAFKKGL